MARNQNTTRSGGGWSEKEKNDVWNKGREIPKYDKSIWRWDRCGHVMKHEDHGDRDSKYGWEIDHIDPVSNGGSDNLSNLQPLNWKNNTEKADKLDWTCS